MQRLTKEDAKKWLEELEELEATIGVGAKSEEEEKQEPEDVSVKKDSKSKL